MKQLPIIPALVGIVTFFVLRAVMEKPQSQPKAKAKPKAKKTPTFEEGRYWIATLKGGEEVMMESKDLESAVRAKEVERWREI